MNVRVRISRVAFCFPCSLAEALNHNAHQSHDVMYFSRTCEQHAGSVVVVLSGTLQEQYPFLRINPPSRILSLHLRDPLFHSIQPPLSNPSISLDTVIFTESGRWLHAGYSQVYISQSSVSAALRVVVAVERWSNQSLPPSRPFSSTFAQSFWPKQHRKLEARHCRSVFVLR